MSDDDKAMQERLRKFFSLPEDSVITIMFTAADVLAFAASESRAPHAVCWVGADSPENACEYVSNSSAIVTTDEDEPVEVEPGEDVYEVELRARKIEAKAAPGEMRPARGCPHALVGNEYDAAVGHIRKFVDTHPEGCKCPACRAGKGAIALLMGEAAPGEDGERATVFDDDQCCTDGCAGKVDKARSVAFCAQCVDERDGEITARRLERKTK